MAVMELVATTAVTMGPVTSQAMMMTRVAMMTGADDISAGEDDLEYY
jgi:hypothetical protein